MQKLEDLTIVIGHKSVEAIRAEAKKWKESGGNLTEFLGIQTAKPKKVKKIRLGGEE